MLKKSILLVMLLFLGFSGSTFADGGKITVADAWARATPPSAPTGAAYMTIENKGNAEDRLLSALSDVAEKPQIHTMNMDNGVMQMRELKEGLVIPATGKAVLSPDGTHLMLIGLKRPLIAGEKIDFTLLFEKSGPMKVTANIMPIGYSGDKGESTQNHTAH